MPNPCASASLREDSGIPDWTNLKSEIPAGPAFVLTVIAVSKRLIVSQPLLGAGNGRVKDTVLQWDTMRLLLLLLVFFSASAHAWSLIEPANEACAEEWQRIDPMRRAKIEVKLRSFGISSTGKIKIHNIYTLTHESSLGKKGDKMAMVVQEDLMGDRLFWVVLINLEDKSAQIVYDVRNRNAAAQAGTGQPAARAESNSEAGDKSQPAAQGRSR